MKILRTDPGFYQICSSGNGKEDTKVLAGTGWCLMHLSKYHEKEMSPGKYQLVCRPVLGSCSVGEANFFKPPDKRVKAKKGFRLEVTFSFRQGNQP